MAPSSPLPDASSEQAQYDDYLALPYIVGLAITSFLVTIAIGMRLYAQWLIKNLRAWDNIFAILSFLSLIPLNYFTAWQFRAGAGYHIWRVLAEDPERPANVRTIFIAWYGLTLVSAQACLWIKLAMLMFIKRVLPCDIRLFRLAWWTVMILTILIGIGATIEFTFSCLPISYFWERVIQAFDPIRFVDEGMTPGWCMPLPLYLQVPLIASFITDIFLFLLPLIPLWTMMNLTLWKKVSVFFTLSLGLFAIAIDVVRIYEIVHFDLLGDVTWLNAPGIAWNAIEYNVALVSACIPAMAPLLRRELWKRQGINIPFIYRKQNFRTLHSSADSYPLGRDSSSHSTKNLIRVNDYHVWGDRTEPWRRQSDASLWSDDTRTASREQHRDLGRDAYPYQAPDSAREREHREFLRRESTSAQILIPPNTSSSSGSPSWTRRPSETTTVHEHELSIRDGSGSLVGSPKKSWAGWI